MRDDDTVVAIEAIHAFETEYDDAANDRCDRHEQAFGATYDRDS